MKIFKNCLIIISAIQILASFPAFADGDAVRGKKVFKKCKACHAIKAGKHKIGPSLHGVVGRKAGTAEGFKRYKGLRGAEWVWDAAILDAYLMDPKKYVKENNKKRKSSMVLKVKKKKDRDAVIAYLKTLK